MHRGNKGYLPRFYLIQTDELTLKLIRPSTDPSFSLWGQPHTPLLPEGLDFEGKGRSEGLAVNLRSRSLSLTRRALSLSLSQLETAR
jgi:hypothetical protein